MTPRNPFKTTRSTEWTAERLGRMTPQEIKQLRDNAAGLNETGVVQLCEEALAGKRRTQTQARRAGAPRTKARHLVARIKAFEARGVHLADPRSSWGGVRKQDGAVVLALWADAVLAADGGCRYLLWDSARTWSETPAGRERLAHCQRAVEAGGAEGLLVYGQALEGHLPEERAHAIQGVDAEVVLAFKVEQVGAQYWAAWGRKAR